MPLIQGKSDLSRSKNIAELIKAGHKPSQAAAIAYKEQREAKAKDKQPYDFTIDDDKPKSSREYDLNDYLEVPKTPISKVGVFPYSGGQIGPELEPDKIYMVYRPEAELSDPQTIESFQLLPFTDEHAMLGSEDEGLTSPEKKGVHGVTGEDVFFDAPYLKANVKVFSNKLKKMIEDGKTELSIGYRCIYDQTPGVFEGQRYDFVQKEIRGNHLALVDEGRSGSDVAVLDCFKFTMDAKELQKMGDYSKPDDFETGEMMDEMSLEECGRMIKELMMKVDKMMSGEMMDKDMDKEMMDEENPEAMKELSPEAAKQGDAKDEEMPAKFVKKFEVEDDDEDPDEMEAKRKEKELMRGEDEDYSKEEGDYTKAKGTEKKGMDSQLKALRKEVMDMKQTRNKSLFREISRRDSLANRLSKVIGTFDHKEKTVAEVAAYGLQKLRLKSKPGHEESVLEGYLSAARSSNAVVAQDSAFASTSVDAYLKGVK